jgi:hypothetical protein
MTRRAFLEALAAFLAVRCPASVDGARFDGCRFDGVPFG